MNFFTIIGVVVVVLFIVGYLGFVRGMCHTRELRVCHDRDVHEAERNIDALMAMRR